MGRKRTKEEIAATLAPNEARRKALRETGLLGEGRGGCYGFFAQ
jgi:hypothetical protein